MKNLKTYFETESKYRFFASRDLGYSFTLIAVLGDTIVKRVRYVFKSQKNTIDVLAKITKIVKHQSVLPAYLDFSEFEEVSYNDALELETIYKQNTDILNKFDEDKFFISGKRGYNMKEGKPYKIEPIVSLSHYINTKRKLSAKWQ